MPEYSGGLAPGISSVTPLILTTAPLTEARPPAGSNSGSPSMTFVGSSVPVHSILIVIRVSPEPDSPEPDGMSTVADVDRTLVRPLAKVTKKRPSPIRVSFSSSSFFSSASFSSDSFDSSFDPFDSSSDSLASSLAFFVSCFSRASFAFMAFSFAFMAFSFAFSASFFAFSVVVFYYGFLALY
jgi:hypothetical protein